MTNIEKQQIMLNRYKKLVHCCDTNKIVFNPITNLFDLIFCSHSNIKYKFCFLTLTSAERFRDTMLY